jgi:hypothetical protein
MKEALTAVIAIVAILATGLALIALTVALSAGKFALVAGAAAYVLHIIGLATISTVEAVALWGAAFGGVVAILNILAALLSKE